MERTKTSKTWSTSEVTELLVCFHTYRDARKKFLGQISCSTSCRDPLAEFSEKLVARLLGAKLADSRVQPGYDLVRPNGRLVQAKCLCNPDPDQQWVNPHDIKFPEGVDEYALVIFTAFQVEAVLIFKRETLGQICALLKKRHPHQDSTLQFTQQNYKSILAKLSEFTDLEMELYRFQAA